MSAPQSLIHCSRMTLFCKANATCEAWPEQKMNNGKTLIFNSHNALERVEVPGDILGTNRLLMH